MKRRRVVITGLGVVAPNGVGKRAFWESSLKGAPCVRRITRFDARGYSCRVAGEVEGFEATDFLHPKVAKQTDRSVHMALACCRMAAEDAGLDLQCEPPGEVGMYFANLFGGMEFAEPELYAQTYLGSARVSAYQAIAWFYAAAQGQWSIATGVRGFGKSIVADRAGGLQALAWGALAIQRGHCSVVFAGGFEAPLVPYVFLIHQSSGLLARSNGDPRRVYRPFDAERTGMVLAEGSAVLVLEELERACRRGAPIYAEIAGYAASHDSAHPADPAPDGRQLARCLRGAMEHAGLEPEQIDHVNAEGVATALADRTEIEALKTVFGGGGSGPTVSAPKAMIGHSLAAAGALDAIWSCLMIRDQVVLPTLHLEQPDPPEGIDYVQHAPRRRKLGAVLCCARGRGGLNTAVILRRLHG